MSLLADNFKKMLNERKKSEKIIVYNNPKIKENPGGSNILKYQTGFLSIDLATSDEDKIIRSLQECNGDTTKIICSCNNKRDISGLGSFGIIDTLSIQRGCNDCFNDQMIMNHLLNNSSLKENNKSKVKFNPIFKNTFNNLWSKKQKYNKRVKNRQTLYNKLIKLGRKL